MNQPLMVGIRYYVFALFTIQKFIRMYIPYSDYYRKIFIDWSANKCTVYIIAHTYLVNQHMAQLSELYKLTTMPECLIKKELLVHVYILCSWHNFECIIT